MFDQIGWNLQINGKAWLNLDIAGLMTWAASTRVKVRQRAARIRLMTRGEALETPEDIARVESICAAYPGIVWLPTRAWTDRTMRDLIRYRLFPIENLRVLASTDPDTTVQQWVMLRNAGFSTMFFGEDSATQTPLNEQFILCPKTHKKEHGACATCEHGCFATHRVNVHLKNHS